ncbi:M23 family metallopeptidase [uncultured Tessaracoccus sp.]|uniref:M23 family metallopeptidase n=1 Tax=uncultured Tessaracoccus sp. TaxID=905023 RepID=UPI002623DAB7|nr:M23 family metallopeptidase [uncultured Tessaracoccus sp.]
MRVLPPKPVRMIVQTSLAVVAAGALFVSVAPLASADDLDDQRNRVRQQISQLEGRRSDLSGQIATQQGAVADANEVNAQAIDALQQAESELANARAALAAAEARMAESEALDQQRQEELEAAEVALEKAKADVAAAEAAYDALNRRIDQEVSFVTQKQGPLVNLALLLTETDANQLNQQAQFGDTLFDVSALELDEAERLRVQLDQAQARADEAERRAAEARQAAAEQLQESRAAKEEAAGLTARVEDLVAARDAAASEAASALQREEAIQQDMEDDAAAVEQRIQARITEAGKLDSQIAERDRKRAEEERKRREEAAKRQREAAAKRAAAQREAQRAAAEKSAASKKSASASKPKTSSGSSKRATSSRTSKRPATTQSSSSSSRGFMNPVPARITSRFGMRVHPVTGVYKLHDGTDFGASCGTPMKAAYDGVVTERYYNRGYGNRLMIDHGRIGGVNVTTGYNHASRYIVGVGQRVSKGQTIGYVGTTGYSTGCHLHLMVWENGRVKNPMSRWFG